MEIPSWLEWSGTKYFAATLLGFLVALAVELAANAVANRRKRRFIREAIAEEVAWNLHMLDQYFDALIAIYRHPVSVLYLPRQRLLTPLMTQSIDPETGSLLTAREWLIATNAIQQCDTINSALLDLRERLVELTAGKDLGQRAAYAKTESARIIDNHLPALGQTFMELLCQVMERQVEYTSTKMMRIAVALAPARANGLMSADRTWRVRYLPNLQARRGTLIAWKNDAPGMLPTDLRVVEIDPGIGGDQVRKHDDNPLRRLSNWQFNRTAAHKLAEQERYLNSTKQSRETRLGNLTELYGDEATERT
ncbi:hypothetical protein BH09CHL1_BH09CHL1_25010 [soil metagenome]